MRSWAIAVAIKHALNKKGIMRWITYPRTLDGSALPNEPADGLDIEFATHDA